MRVLQKTKGLLWLIVTATLLISLNSCKDDDDDGPQPTGDKITYDLASVSDPSISGTVEFSENSDNSTTITIKLTGTSAGETHPAHIHIGNAAEGGGIAVDLSAVDGATGESVTEISQLNDGTAVTYDDLLDFDGYVNVHLSPGDLATLIAQGDIGQNMLTENSEDYKITVFNNPEENEGKFTIYERKNGEVLAVLQLEGTSDGGDHPAHIHASTAAEGGGIVISLSNVNGATGISKTNISQLDDGTAVNFSQLTEFDGYVNVHESSSSLATLIAQGDIGQNELTGENMMYDLFDKVAPSEVVGYVKFEERRNEETLVTIFLENTADGGDHPSHIHQNTAAEGGGIVVPLANVNGATGLSRTNVTQLQSGDPITYEELTNFNGHVNVHLSQDALPTLIAQGDIGQNAFTGESVSYDLNEVGASGISGTAMLYERMNGSTLVRLSLTGTVDGASHPCHIHSGSVAAQGGIAIPLSDVNGATGLSETQVSNMGEEAITYDDLLNFEGYVNIHLSGDDLGVTIAQGNIGANVE